MRKKGSIKHQIRYRLCDNTKLTDNKQNIVKIKTMAKTNRTWKDQNHYEIVGEIDSLSFRDKIAYFLYLEFEITLINTSDPFVEFLKAVWI